MEIMNAHVNFMLHEPVRALLLREAERRGISLGEACRRALYSGIAQPEWGRYRRDSVIVVEEALHADSND